jgi:hypothetical protein
MQKKMLSIAVTCALLLLAVPPSFAQQAQAQKIGNSPIPAVVGYASVPVPPATLSKAVFTTLTQKMLVLQTEAVAGRGLKAATVASAATALESAFANMDETGYTPKLQAWILANTDLFTTQVPTAPELQTAYTALSGAGVKETYAQFVQSITGVSLTVREQFIQQVKLYGLDYVHAQIIATMNATANSAELLRRDNGGRLVHAGGTGWAVAGLYIGIVGVSMLVMAAAGPIAIGCAVAACACDAAGLW